MRLCVLAALVGGAAPRDREGARPAGARRRRLSDSATFKLLATRTASDAAPLRNYGFAVAVDGDTIVSGAAGCDPTLDGQAHCPIICGSVYVLRASDGEELFKLTASDGAAGNFFGESLAIDGGTVVVGARGDNNVTGAVYVFRASDGAQLAKLTASDGAAGDHFGHSVAIDGDTVVVGARGVNTQTGAAYVFRTTDGWDTYVEVAKLTASDGAYEDLFGQSVAINGATVVVGASQSRKLQYGLCPSLDCSGAAYLFRTLDDGATYGQMAKLTATDAAAGDGFGWSVAFDSGTVVVGAYGDDDACTDNLLCNSGAAYVYSLSDDGVVYSKLTAPDAAADDYFGVSVAIDGETIVVGAYAKNFGTGAAYVYRTSDGGTTHDHVAKLTSPGAVGDAFGISVAIDGAAVVVGASQWLNGGSGSAYVYEEIPQKTASSSQSAYNLTSDAARSLPAAATLLAAGAALAF